MTKYFVVALSTAAMIAPVSCSASTETAIQTKSEESGTRGATTIERSETEAGRGPAEGCIDGVNGRCGDGNDGGGNDGG